MGGKNMVIKLMSDAFDENGSIPPRYTCDDENISPPLHWDTLPEHTISLAIICEDPDAPGGIFTHWIISNLTSDIMNLEAGIKKEGMLENGAVQGVNDFGFLGYGGPCNPGGTEHRFVFKIYALDTTLNLNPGFKRGEFLRALNQNILDEGQLIGLYRR